MDAPQHDHPQDPGACHNCKQPLEAGAKFCAYCGHPVPTAVHPAQKVQPIKKEDTIAAAQTVIHAAWKLSVIQGPDQGKTFTLGAITRIGRGVDNEVQILDTQSSRYHAQIQRSSAPATGVGYVIDDLGSTNGTLVNGVRITGPTMIQSGTNIQVGNTHFIVLGTDVGQVTGTPASMQTPVVPMAPPTIPPSAYSTRPPAPPAQATSPQQVPPPPSPRTTSPQQRPTAPPPQATSPQQYPPPIQQRASNQPPSSVPPPPPSQPTAGIFRPPPQKKAPPPVRKRNWLRTCLILLVLFACGLIAAGVGIYYGLSSGVINQRTVLNAVGQGAGEVTITNIADVDLTADLIQLETEDGQPSTLYSDTFFSLDIGGWGGIQPGLYDLVIVVEGPPFGGTCRMRFESGDQYTFVVVPQGIAVALEGYVSTTADELDMATSALCRK